MPWRGTDLPSGLSKIKQFLIDKNKRTLYLSYLGFYDRLDDESFIKLKFKAILGYSADLDNPRSFNEKMNWLKLHDRNPEYVRLVDKYEVKKIIADRLGAEYIIPNLGVWDRPEEIDFSQLPKRFVLKCTHDSGSKVICTDKSELNYGKARNSLRKCLGNDYYKLNREWMYKDLKHRIIAEEYIENECGYLNDFRFYCFNGNPEFFSIDFREGDKHLTNFYDSSLNLLPFGSAKDPPVFDADLKIPANIGKMLDIARTLSKGHPFLRVDLYNINGKIYFSELTFFTHGGFFIMYPDQSWDWKIGDKFALSDR